MIVRCGACRTQFDVPGEGRHQCPACAAVNQVGMTAPGGPAGMAPGPPPAPGEMGPQGGQAPAPSGPPPRRAECGECGFAFIVGDIDLATCPNCLAEVATRSDDAADEE